MPKHTPWMNEWMNDIEQNRKKVFDLLDNIQEEDIKPYQYTKPDKDTKPYQSYRSDDFDLQKSVTDFKNFLNSGKLLTWVDSLSLTQTYTKPIFFYIWNTLQLDQERDKNKNKYRFKQELLSAYVWPGNPEEKIIPQTTPKIDHVVHTTTAPLLDEISQNLSQKEIEAIRQEVIEEKWFPHPTRFAELLQEANKKAKQKKKDQQQENVVNIVNAVIKLWNPWEKEGWVYDDVNILTIPDEDTIRWYLLSSVTYWTNYFVEKRQWLIRKIYEKKDENLTEKDLYDIIAKHKEQVDPMAKEALKIKTFIQKISQHQK